MNAHLAILGATGAVGTLMRTVLQERNLRPRSVRFLASAKSAGQTVEFFGERHAVRAISPAALDGVQLVLSSTPASISREFAPIAAKLGAIVVDNSSAWRMDPAVPLVVPEVNSHELANTPKGIVANPNCVAIPLTVVLHPLRALGEFRRVVVSTYQSSSGKGATGLADFDPQARAFGLGEPVPAPTAHRGQLAGNVLALDWTLDDNGGTEEENKVVNETRKILGLPNLAVHPTCVRVPVRVAHSEAVHLEFDRPVTVAAAKELLASAPGVALCADTPKECPQPLTAAGSDSTFVGRVRQQAGSPNTLELWLVADNLRKGAATNAVQCAVELVRLGRFG